MREDGGNAVLFVFGRGAPASRLRAKTSTLAMRVLGAQMPPNRLLQLFKRARTRRLREERSVNVLRRESSRFRHGSLIVAHLHTVIQLALLCRARRLAGRVRTGEMVDG